VFVESARAGLTSQGRMLQLIRQHLLPSPSSLLFLVLPLPCITNSRYLSRGLLIQIMAEVGFSMVHERSKAGGKVGYWLFKWAEPVAPTARTRRKRIICDGPGKNNFAVVLDDPLGAGDEDDVEDET
jgi:25S rRNA (adenine2142-N1)-methyltransferase